MMRVVFSEHSCEFEIFHLKVYKLHPPQPPEIASDLTRDQMKRVRHRV